MRISGASPLFLLSPLLLSACLQQDTASRHARFEEVVISVANQDLRSPVALVTVDIDGTTVFRGAITGSVSGQYTYFVTQLPVGTGAVISAASRAEGGIVLARKRIWIKEGIWIVITRSRAAGDDDPYLDISVSYEKGLPDAAESLSIPQKKR